MINFNDEFNNKRKATKTLKKLGYECMEEFQLYNDVTANLFIMPIDNKFLNDLQKYYMEILSSDDIEIALYAKSKLVMQKIIKQFNLDEKFNKFARMSHIERIEYNAQEQTEFLCKLSDECIGNASFTEIQPSIIEPEIIRNINGLAKALGYKDKDEFDLYNDTTTNFHFLTGSDETEKKEFEKNYFDAVVSESLLTRLYCKSKTIQEKIIKLYHLEEKLKKFANMTHLDRLEYNHSEQDELLTSVYSPVYTKIKVGE